MSKKYVVSVNIKGWKFFVVKDNECCECHLKNSVTNLETAKQIFNKNNYGKVELREYKNEKYKVLQSKEKYK